MIVFGYITKNLALSIQRLWLSCLISEKSHVNSATPVHPSQKQCIFGFTCGFSGVQLKSQKRKFLVATFLVRYPKNFILKFLAESLWIAVPKRPFSCTNKNPGANYTTSFDFLQWSRSSTIPVSIMNRKSDISQSMYERHSLPMCGTTSPKRRRIALKSNHQKPQNLP